MRLPACVFVTRAEVLRGAAAAARTALRGLEELRRANSALPWLASTGGPAAANSKGLTRGVVKLGWSWEAKYVWFWRGEAQLARYISLYLPISPYAWVGAAGALPRRRHGP